MNVPALLYQTAQQLVGGCWWADCNTQDDCLVTGVGQPAIGQEVPLLEVLNPKDQGTLGSPHDASAQFTSH